MCNASGIFKRYLLFNRVQVMRRSNSLKPLSLFMLFISTYPALLSYNSFQTTSCCRIEGEDQIIKTSVNFITHPKEKSSKKKAAYITRYGPKGFVVQGSRVVGSLAILPGILLHWKVNSPEEINAESLEVFTIVDPSLDIVVIGTGDRVVRLDKNVHKAMREKGIALEVQDTANACATHNFLLEEGRSTGAALIPPSRLQT